MTYFKLNNHSAHEKGCVAYYRVPAQLVGGAGGFGLVQPGGRLDLVVNEYAHEGLQEVPVGSRIVIFQNIRGRSQVVTHLLRVTGADTFAHGLGGAFVDFADWPYARTTVVERMLKPAAFGGQANVFDAETGAMMAQHQPHPARRLEHLLDGHANVGNGRVYPQFDGLSIKDGATDQHLVPAHGYLIAPVA